MPENAPCELQIIVHVDRAHNRQILIWLTLLKLWCSLSDDSRRRETMWGTHRKSYLAGLQVVVTASVAFIGASTGSPLSPLPSKEARTPQHQPVKHDTAVESSGVVTAALINVTSAGFASSPPPLCPDGKTTAPQVGLNSQTLLTRIVVLLIFGSEQNQPF